MAANADAAGDRDGSLSKIALGYEPPDQFA
jgi:hypothetical protein